MTQTISGGSEVESVSAIKQALPARSLLIMTLILGFASGLPLALSAGTMQAWLTVENVDLKTLGWLTLVGLPYTYKFVWAPMLDRYRVPIVRSWGGRRRGWLTVLLVAMALVLFAMSRQTPGALCRVWRRSSGAVPPTRQRVRRAAR